jgi:hypothetical protein
MTEPALPLTESCSPRLLGSFVEDVRLEPAVPTRPPGRASASGFEMLGEGDRSLGIATGWLPTKMEPEAPRSEGTEVRRMVEDLDPASGSDVGLHRP